MAASPLPMQLPFAENGVAVPTNSFAVTPSDSEQLPHATRAIYVGVTGDITMFLNNDAAAVLFKAVPVGMYWLSTNQIKATGTTASDIVGLY